MKPVEQPVFLYMDYREYLGNWYERTQKHHPRFSLRAFAKLVGFRSHNFLKMVMQGKRNLTGESIQKLVKGLKLGRREGSYFRTLVFYNQATDPEERQQFYEQLLQAQELSQVKTLLQDQYTYYSAWYHTVVRELISHSQFKEDPVWIASRLSPSITAEEAQESLELLQRLGLIERDSAGKFRPSAKLVTTGPEVYAQSVVQYHRSILDLAKAAIDRFPRQKRDISSLTLGISQGMLPILKRRIQLFREEVMRLISTDQVTDTVIQLNFQLFPLTTLAEEGKKHA